MHGNCEVHLNNREYKLPWFDYLTAKIIHIWKGNLKVKSIIIAKVTTHWRLISEIADTQCIYNKHVHTTDLVILTSYQITLGVHCNM